MSEMPGCIISYFAHNSVRVKNINELNYSQFETIMVCFEECWGVSNDLACTSLSPCWFVYLFVCLSFFLSVCNITQNITQCS